MKRLTLLTILLVVVGLTAGFALDVKPSAELTGSGTVKWGVDLDTGYTGFLNEAEAELIVSLFAEDTEETNKGEGDWYGSITLSDVELFWTNGEQTPGFELTIDDHILAADPHVLTWAFGAEPGVEATIVGLGGNLVIGVFDAPTIGFDFVEAIEDDEDDDYVVPDYEDPTLVGGDYAQYGTFVSYNVSEMLMLGFEVVSEDDWTLNAAQAYAFALEVQVKLGGIEFDAGANYGVNYATDPFGFGAKVAYSSDALEAWAGIDAESDAAFAWEAGAGATITLMEGVTAELGVVYGDTYYQDLDAMVAFTEPGDAGLVDGLDASLKVWILDVLDDAADDDLEYAVAFDAGYQMGKAYPHFGVEYGDPNDAAAYLDVYVHCDYDLFEAAPTTAFIEWDSGDLLGSELGTLVVGVTVEY